MPVNLTNHDMLANQLKQSFIDKYLLNRSHENRIQQQLITVFRNNWQPLVGQKLIDKCHQKKTVNHKIINQLENTLFMYQIAMPSNKVKVFKQITNELLKQVEKEITSWEWYLNVHQSLIDEFNQYLKTPTKPITNLNSLNILTTYIDAWQLQILNLYYVPTFAMQPFELNTSPNQYSHLNLYEIGLTELPNRVFIDYILNHIYPFEAHEFKKTHKITKLIQAVHHLSKRNRYIMQNEFIEIRTGYNENELTAFDRQNLYYQTTPTI